MRTATLFIIFVLALTSCACGRPRNPSDPVRTGAGVTVELFESRSGPFPRYDIVMTFTQRADYTHLVQEIEMDGGWWLVECFRVARGYTVWDHHTGAGWRRMRVYPADVVGACELHGFAHLDRNQAGDVVTRLPDGFNASYCAAFPGPRWPGVITRQAPETASTWRITPDDGLRRVEVWTGGGVVFIK